MKTIVTEQMILKMAAKFTTRTHIAYTYALLDEIAELKQTIREKEQVLREYEKDDMFP